MSLLRDAIAKRIVHGVLEDGVLYTQSFVRRERARLRGALAAVTVPTPVQKLQAALGTQKKLFYQFLDELVGRDAYGELTGKVHTCLCFAICSFYVSYICVLILGCDSVTTTNLSCRLSTAARPNAPLARSSRPTITCPMSA